MHLEIERKFLVVGDDWRELATDRRDLKDGLVSQGANGKVRVRLDGPRAWLTVKGARTGISRPEFEYEIPFNDARNLLANVCVGPVVEKTRYVVPHESHEWEVDVFQGVLAGIVWAEIELAREDEPFVTPEWVGREVTGDPRFRHANLLLLATEDAKAAAATDKT